MATYKKRGAKKSVTKTTVNETEIQSTTAEVFETLDTSASRTEAFVAKYQNVILIGIGVITLGVLGYLGYDSYVISPNNTEAVSELNQAQYYFNLAVNGEDSEVFYKRAINGGEGRYGFLDIIDNYGNTPAADLATYSTGMAFLNLKEYQKAIDFLKDFSTNDVLLSSLAFGAIGDAYAALEDNASALDYYQKAFNESLNDFTTPKYLFKAGIMSDLEGNKKAALAYFKRIQEEFPESQEGKQIKIQIGRLEN